jgi:hypothetical protein
VAFSNRGGEKVFNQIRRKDREMEKKEAKELLKRGEYGVLSTVGENEYAYGVPLSYAYVDEAIYFHCAQEGYKLDNLRGNNKVSFCVVGKTNVLPDKFSTEYESVIVFGIAKEVAGEEKTMVLMELIKKYSPDYIEEGKKYIERAGEKTKVIKIDMEYISGKARA